ncbi:MAG: TPM domain-containing protein [Bacteroidota bacterium]
MVMASWYTLFLATCSVYMSDRIRFVVLLALAALYLPASAQTRASLPPAGYVVDEADSLPPAAEQRLAQQLQSLDDYTSVQMSVVTVPSLGGIPARAYALRLMREWGVGQRGLNNGVLILFAPGGQQVHVSVGTGLEWQIPDSVAAEAVQRMIPLFQAGAYPAGLQAGVAFLSERASSVAWDIRYSGLDTLPERRTRAVGAVVRLEGTLSPDGMSLMSGGERVALFYPPYWEFGSSRSVSATLLGRIVTAEPLAVQVLGMIE